MPDTTDLVALRDVIERAKTVAQQYRQITGKPLGITGEVGEFIVTDLLNLKLSEARQQGYDAIALDGHRIQIKARCILRGEGEGQRLGSIRLNHEWDTVMLVLMNSDYEPLAVYEANREDIERELTVPGSKARNERGALSVRKFKSIASIMWPSGLIPAIQ